MVARLECDIGCAARNGAEGVSWLKGLPIYLRQQPLSLRQCSTKLKMHFSGFEASAKFEIHFFGLSFHRSLYQIQRPIATGIFSLGLIS